MRILVACKNCNKVTYYKTSFFKPRIILPDHCDCYGYSTTVRNTVDSFLDKLGDKIKPGEGRKAFLEQ